MEEIQRNNNDTERREIINKIKELNFAIIELGLYLDTHPNDRRTLNLHNQYSKEVKELKQEYQKKFEPLTIFYPSNQWNWIDIPWPWERGNF